MECRYASNLYQFAHELAMSPAFAGFPSTLHEPTAHAVGYNMPPAPPALAFGFFLTPAGVAACSRWLSVVCDTTGTEILQFRTPAGVPASCKIKALAPFQGPSRVRNRWRIFPVVSQKTLNHRLQAATPPGSRKSQTPEPAEPAAYFSPQRKLWVRIPDQGSPRSGRHRCSHAGNRPLIC